MTKPSPFLQVQNPDGRLCRLTLDRPPTNALDSDLIETITRIVRTLSQREEPPVLLLAAEGERFFSAGGDIRELDGTDADHALRRMGRFHDMLVTLAGYPSAIVVAVRGYAAGGGLELTLMGDVVIAGEGAQFGFPEIRHGLMPAIMGIRRAVGILGRRGAFDLLSSGRFLPAREALAMGLVSRVVPDAEVLAQATEAAAALADRDPLVLGIMKRAVGTAEATDEAAMRAMTLTEFHKILSRPSAVEARRRFLTKDRG